MFNPHASPFNLNFPIYIELSDIKKENDKITNSLKQLVYQDYTPENEKNENEKAGEFLYLIGGIARRSLNLSMQIYEQLFPYFLL